MQQVRGGMVGADAVALLRVDGEGDRIACFQRTGCDGDAVRVQAVDGFAGVGNIAAACFGADGAGIAYLAAGFGVERGLVNQHIAGFACL